MNPQTLKFEEFIPKMGGGTPKRGGVNALCCLIDSNPNLGPFQPQFWGFLGPFGEFWGVPLMGVGGTNPQTPKCEEFTPKMGGDPKRWGGECVVLSH